MTTRKEVGHPIDSREIGYLISASPKQQKEDLISKYATVRNKCQLQRHPQRNYYQWEKFG